MARYRAEKPVDYCSPIARRNFVEAISRKLAELPDHERSRAYDSQERSHFDSWYMFGLSVTMPYRYKSEKAQKRLKSDCLRAAAKLAAEKVA